jgi:predicted nucleotidyltransferase
LNSYLLAYTAAMTMRPDCLDVPLIAEHLEAIRALCRDFGVARLEVLGSVCTDAFDLERSDIDFLIDYPEGYEFGPWLGRHFDLKVRLESLLGRPVDLVMTGAQEQILHPFNERNPAAPLCGLT